MDTETLLGVDHTAVIAICQAAIDAAQAALDAAPGGSCGYPDCNQCKTSAVYDAYDNAKRAARLVLGQAILAGGDLLSIWIVDNYFDGYSEEAIEILSRFPWSLDSLDNYAYNNSWCPVWQRAKVRAVRAGVLPQYGAYDIDGEDYDY